MVILSLLFGAAGDVPDLNEPVELRAPVVQQKLQKRVRIHDHQRSSPVTAAVLLDYRTSELRSTDTENVSPVPLGTSHPSFVSLDPKNQFFGRNIDGLKEP